jgi:hypothetical protein
MQMAPTMRAAPVVCGLEWVHVLDLHCALPTPPMKLKGTEHCTGTSWMWQAGMHPHHYTKHIYLAISVGWLGLAAYRYSLGKVNETSKKRGSAFQTNTGCYCLSDDEVAGRRSLSGCLPYQRLSKLQDEKN